MTHQNWIKAPFTKPFSGKARGIIMSLLMGATFASPLHASDLTVWFKETDGGVRITIDTWLIPEGLPLSEQVTANHGVYYSISNTLDDTFIAVKNTDVIIPNPPGYYIFPLGLDRSGVDGGTLDFSKLALVSPTAVSTGNVGGLKLIKLEGEDTAQALFVFDSYDESTRIATFGLSLWLPDVSFSDLFVEDAFADGAFDVWTSDAFSVKFSAIPEPSSFVLATCGVALFGKFFRRRRTAGEKKAI